MLTGKQAEGLYTYVIIVKCIYTSHKLFNPFLLLIFCSFRKYKLEEVNKHESLKCHRNCVRFFKAWEERYFVLFTACLPPEEMLFNNSFIPDLASIYM